VIGAIARAHGDAGSLVSRLQPYQRRALDDIAACATPACGMHTEICSACGDTRLAPNTCGNRACPHCQGADRAAWVAERSRELLPGVGFFHAVFTVPPAIRRLAQVFPRVVLDALLRASADAVLTLCRDPDRLGAEVGLVEVLHTWTRDLRWHPHVHQIVTAGGWDGARHCWVAATRQGVSARPFLLPLPVLRAAYQRRFMHLLLDAYEHGHFGDTIACPELASLPIFRRHLAALVRGQWCIRIEPPFGSPEILLKYLGAYINRVAISPRRITAHDPAANAGAGSVTWTYATNADPDRTQIRVATGIDFLAAFAQHILPPRLVRIRFRGLWCTAHRRTKLDCARAWLLAQQPQASPEPATPPPSPSATELPPEPDPRRRCSTCGLGSYQRLPGTCPRPNRRERGQLLTAIRAQERTAAAVEGHAIA